MPVKGKIRRELRCEQFVKSNSERPDVRLEIIRITGVLLESQGRDAFFFEALNLPKFTRQAIKVTLLDIVELNKGCFPLETVAPSLENLWSHVGWRAILLVGQLSRREESCESEISKFNFEAARLQIHSFRKVLMASVVFKVCKFPVDHDVRWL